MTVNTVSPAIISRAEFNLNAGQKQTPQLVRMDFTNLVTNGTFDTDTDWTKGTDWTIGSGVASKAAGAASNLDQSTLSLFQSRKYAISADFTISAGGIVTRLGTGNSSGNVGTQATTTGTYSYVSYPLGGLLTTIQLTANTATVGSVDNVSLYEADPSDDAPWLRLPYGYSVGRTGMIVRDGVVLHPSDYTEIKDSGQTWIKPIVAPGVSTEFSIWGSAS